MSTYGTEYERKIGKAEARRLIGESRGLPRMGYSMVVRSATEKIEGNDWTSYLSVDNLSGQLYLRCCNNTRSRWLELFGVE